LSNKHHRFTVRCIEHYFPGVHFAAVQGYTGQYPHKPDPSAARHVCRQMGLARAEGAFVGDTATDMRTAVACGNMPVGVRWGFRDEAELKAAGAQLIIDRPADLPGAFA